MKTLRQRREYYKSIEGTMTQEEIIQSMPDDELRANARRGGRDAITELARRKIERDNHIIPQPEIDVGV